MQFYLVIDRKSLQHEIDKKFFSSSFVHCKSKVTIKYINPRGKNLTLVHQTIKFSVEPFSILCVKQCLKNPIGPTGPTTTTLPSSCCCPLFPLSLAALPPPPPPFSYFKNCDFNLN